MPGLAALQRAIALVVCDGPAGSSDRAVVVPSERAAAELRRTLERLLLVDGWRPATRDLERARVDADRQPSPVLLLPHMVTRAGLYALLQVRAGVRGPLLDPVDRDVLLGLAATRAEEAGHRAPFHRRPGLVGDMIAFYDSLRRHRRTVDDFERLLVQRLEPAADYDRGASRLLQETRFLAAAFRAYEERLTADRLLDEHRLRELLLRTSAAHPIRHIVLAVADDIAEPGGLWAADFDLLMQLDGVERLDVVATDRWLSAGLYERLQHALPGIEECQLRDIAPPQPVLIAPADGDQLYARYRDREHELTEVVRRIKVSAVETLDRDASVAASLDDTVIVYQRPLPYLYVARQVLDAARVPWEATDALPLAAEPVAAALDLLLAFVTSGFSRDAALPLLASPHFSWGRDRWVPSAEEVDAFRMASADAELLAGGDMFAALAREWIADSTGDPVRRLAARCAHALADAARDVAALTVPAPVSALVAALTAFLDVHERVPVSDPIVLARHLRARAAIRAILDAVSASHRRWGDLVVPVEELWATIKRWIESHTFEPRVGTAGGVRLTDAETARFGAYSAVHLVGLVEGEWPQPVRQSVFYPASLLADLGWPSERDRVRSARASFLDLLGLASSTVHLSTFELEDDALVRASTFVEDLEQAGLIVERETGADVLRVFADEAMTEQPLAPEALDGDARDWLEVRLARVPASDQRFHGYAGGYTRDTHGVTAIETYLACPFKYFAGRVLRLDEEQTAAPGLDPLERGRFVHEVFRRFFDAWSERGYGAVTAASLPDARALLGVIVETLLVDAPDSARPVERARLLGSAASAGMGDRVLRLEAERDVAIVERQLEVDLGGVYPIGPEPGRALHLRGIADRIDLTADGHLHVYDYKSGQVPRRDRAVQLPIYGRCAEERLAGHRGRRWTVAEAAYVALSGSHARAVRIAGLAQREEAFAEAEARLLTAVEGIERGEFPPRPSDLSLCTSCAWAAVCRKDYVDVPA